MRAPGPFAAIALFAFLAALLAPVMPRAPYGTYFGPLPAPLAMILVAGLGLAANARLNAAGWPPARWPKPRRLGAYAALGAAFALPTVGLDLRLPFARDINAPIPEALLFYPAIGLVAETVFHLLPLALITAVAPRAIVPATLVVALVEPVFQVALGGGITGRNMIMAAILFAFGIAQVTALRRHGFAAAYAMRIGYYLVWHILWGSARLGLLFAD